jgi:hypothetical protein
MNKLQENASGHIWDPTQKKNRNSQSTKWQILAKFLRSALLVDRHFAVFIALHAENVWQSNRNYLNISLKNIESFFDNLRGSRRLFGENMNIFKIIM